MRFMRKMQRVHWMGVYCLIIAVVALSVNFMLRRDAVRANHDTPSLPPGYSNTTVATLSGQDPIGLTFTPDGRLLITTRIGYLRVYQNNTLLSTPALDLSSRVCSNQEQGMLGVVPDPAFATNRYIYVYYTFNKFNQPLPCPKESPQSPVNRVSRFTLGDNNIVNPASEVILFDNIPATGAIHNGGDLQFGKDGYLYIAVGDGGCDYAGDSGCSRYNDAARDQHVLLGKILRVQIGADGRTSIPPTNPFIGADSVRCSATGRTDPGKKCQETFAWGLRNPFRTPHDPNAAGTRFFINDVGQGFWEEINEGQVGADYGWSEREGRCVIDSKTNCGPQPSGMTNPIFDYPHSIDCAAGGVTGNAISAGAFVPNGLWPGMDNSYLFAEYSCGRLFKLTPSGTGYSASVFGTNMGVGGGIVTMIFGPHNGGQALYYTSFAHDKLYRITYTGSGNRTPVAQLTATNTAGPSPLTVRFNAGDSSDPDGDALTYLWDFGDGATDQTTTNTISHTYTAQGVYNARLQVRDSKGAVSLYSESVRIDVGNTPPVPKIEFPTTTTKFKTGQTLVLRGSATDAESTASDKRLPDSALSWRVELVHNEHTHPVLQPTSGNNIPIVGPAPEDLDPDTINFLRIYLTATDAEGRTTTISQDLQPNKVSIRLTSNPTGLRLFVNGSPVTTPVTFSSWEDNPLRVVAPAQINGSGQGQMFKSWSQGGPSSQTIMTPGTSEDYIATFVSARVRFMPFVPR